MPICTDIVNNKKDKPKEVIALFSQTDSNLKSNSRITKTYTEYAIKPRTDVAPAFDESNKHKCCPAQVSRKIQIPNLASPVHSVSFPATATVKSSSIPSSPAVTKKLHSSSVQVDPNNILPQEIQLTLGQPSNLLQQIDPR